MQWSRTGAVKAALAVKVLKPGDGAGEADCRPAPDPGTIRQDEARRHDCAVIWLY
jgi:hypothetical protein